MYIFRLLIGRGWLKMSRTTMNGFIIDKYEGYCLSDGRQHNLHYALIR